MKKSFTYAERRGARLFIKEAWKDDNGVVQKQQRVIDNFKFEMFLPATSGRAYDALSIFSTPLSRIEFDNVSEMVDFCKENENLHGMEDPVVQFLHKEYPGALELDMDLFTIMNCDIEVSHDNGFPYPDKAEDEVLSITFKNFNGPSFTLGTKFSKNKCHIICANEVHLLKTFLDRWEANNPDIFTGWNSTKFDMVYLVNRIRKVLGNDEVRRLSCFHKHCKHIFSEREDKSGDKFFEILGFTQIDYMELYKKFAPEKRESYKLDYIAMIEIDERKITYAEYGNSLMRLWRGQPVASRKEGAIETQKWEACRVDLRIFADERNVNLEPCEGVDIFDIEVFNNLVMERVIEDADIPAFYARAKERVEQLSYDLFIEYNERDVELVEKLDNKLSYISNLIGVAFMVKCKILDAMGTIAPWDAYMYQRLLAKNMQPPPFHKQKSIGLKGGFVKQPVPGLRHWVVTLDLASLYPNIVRTLNMSPETKVASAGEWVIERLLNEERGLAEPGQSIAANGSAYRLDTVGLIPEAMSDLLNSRNVVKGEMKETQKLKVKAKTEHSDNLKELEYKIKRLDSKQKAIKTLANGGYGALASAYFRYFDLDIAEGITSTGQTIIKFIANRINAHLSKLLGVEKDYVIASDTDSCMVDISVFMYGYIDNCGMPEKYSDLIDAADAFVKKNLEEDVLKPSFELIAELLGAKVSTLSMKREAIADRGLFRAKKHYVLQVWDNEGVRYAEPELKMMGIETARSSIPKFCKDKITEALKIILNKDESDLKTSFKQWKLEFLKLDIEDIAFPRGVSETEKWNDNENHNTNNVFDEEDETQSTIASIKKGAPPQVKAALCFNFFLEKLNIKHRDPITPGSRLKFLYLKKGNLSGYNVIGFTDDYPEEFGLTPWIDKELQFQKSLLKPIESFTKLVNWRLDDKAILTNSIFTEEVENTKAIVSTPQPVKEKKATVKPLPDQKPRKVAKKSNTIQF